MGWVYIACVSEWFGGKNNLLIMKVKLLMFAALFAGFSVSGSAAVIVNYDFSVDANPTTQLVNTSSTAVNSTSAQWTGSSNNGRSTAGNFFGRGPKTTELTSYIQFTVSADPTYVFDLTQLSYGYQMSQIQSANPRSFTFETRSSVDGFGSAISGTYSTNPVTAGGASFHTATFDLSGGTYDGLDEVTFRLYVTGNVTPNTNDIARWDNILVEGGVTLIPEPSAALLGGLGVLLLLRRRR